VVQTLPRVHKILSGKKQAHKQKYYEKAGEVAQGVGQ
jgi:hypothetical protein